MTEAFGSPAALGFQLLIGLIGTVGCAYALTKLLFRIEINDSQVTSSKSPKSNKKKEKRFSPEVEKNLSELALTSSSDSTDKSSDGDGEDEDLGGANGTNAGKSKKESPYSSRRRLRKGDKMSIIFNVLMLAFMEYLLLVFLPSGMIPSLIAMTLLSAILLRNQLIDELRRGRLDRISAIMTLIVFMASFLCLLTFAVIGRSEGSIYEGPARIVGYDSENYDNDSGQNSQHLRADLQVSWGGDWGCPDQPSHECTADVSGALCEVSETRKRQRGRKLQRTPMLVHHRVLEDEDESTQALEDEIAKLEDEIAQLEGDDSENDENKELADEMHQYAYEAVVEEEDNQILSQNNEELEDENSNLEKDNKSLQKKNKTLKTDALKNKAGMNTSKNKTLVSEYEEYGYDEKVYDVEGGTTNGETEQVEIIESPDGSETEYDITDEADGSYDETIVENLSDGTSAVEDFDVDTNGNIEETLVMDNPDGSEVTYYIDEDSEGNYDETTVEDHVDGTETEIILDEELDGSYSQDTTTTKTDGSKTEDSIAEDAMGDFSEDITTTNTDGSKTEDDVDEYVDGAFAEDIISTNADGSETEDNIYQDADGSSSEEIDTFNTDGSANYDYNEKDTNGGYSEDSYSENADGSVTDHYVDVDSNGYYLGENITENADGSSTDNYVTKSKDGYSTEENVKYNTDGSYSDTTIDKDVDGNSDETIVKESGNGDETMYYIDKDSNGNTDETIMTEKSNGFGETVTTVTTIEENSNGTESNSTYYTVYETIDDDDDFEPSTANYNSIDDDATSGSGEGGFGDDLYSEIENSVEEVLFFDDDFFETDYWSTELNNVWGDYACNDLFDTDLEELSYDASEAPGNDEWPFVNIYGSCNSCTAFLVDYYSTEHFNNIKRYQTHAVEYATFGILSLIVTLALVVKQYFRPAEENQIDLLMNEGGRMV